MILREPNRSRWEVEQLLVALKKILPDLILHASNVNGWRFAEIHNTGLHLPSHVDPKLWRGRFSGRLGISCHREEEVLAAAASGLDYVLLSPIFSPISKEDDRPTLGPEEAGRIQALCDIPVFGLGGICQRNARQCKGLHGIASMGYLFGTRTDRKRLSARTKRLFAIVQKAAK
jgi:thiamine monophosphate synthase